MKDEKKHLYRIDPLKVKQKLYELYPQGSEAHKMMAKEEKIKEYTQLSRTISSMPTELVKEMAEQNKLSVLKMTGKMFVLLVLAATFGIVVLFSSTTLEAILSGALLVVCLWGAARQLFRAGRLAYSIKSFEESLQKAKDRMDKLQKDIFS